MEPSSSGNEIFDKLTKLKERREFLEQCLNSKCAELTKICIGEAELTGKLPVETPLGPDGCLPRFRSVMRSVSLNTEDFLKIQQSNIKQMEVVSKRNGRVKGSPKKSRIRSIWETLPTLSNRTGEISANHLNRQSDINTWPHRSSPTKTNRTHPYFMPNKS